ncbi:MAG: cysteine--tRNA ligase [Epsilonproteobacteria bacterium]|nr:cysteine--tRNA ligase [Campylobacterota bacterium]
MYLYDTSKKEKREFIPLKPNQVKLYVCGPTVYDDAHLGHAKSALTFDLLRRILEANGYEVTYARNITDIDDKILKKSLTTNKSISEITSFYTDRFHAEMAQLGVIPPTIEPKATQNIDAMIELIQKLLDEKVAYQISNGDIYFDTTKDENYLSLSHKIQDEEDKQQRIEANQEKRNSADFALWKAVDDETTAFDAPFGKGRPGWHLECSAMIEKHLAYNDTPYAIDIHGGGADLLFPHHENEAAQTRCATHRELANYWIHNGFVQINGEKMSKSLGNSFFLKDALKEYDGEVLRFYLLSTHYRSDFNFSTEDLEASKKRLDKLYRLKKRLFGLSTNELETDFQKELLEALNDDLNISKALSIIDEFITKTNETLDTAGKHKNLKKEAQSNLTFIEKILGFGIKNPFEYFQNGIDKETKQKINALIEQRDEAKKEKDFIKADTIRDEILSFGVQIMDTPQGTFWEKV